MGIMRLCVYLLTVGVVSCLGSKDASAPATEPQYEQMDPAQRFFDILGRFFCIGEKCEGYELPVTERDYEQPVAGDDYEPQLPDAEIVNATDSYPKLCENLVKLVRDMEAADPNTTRLKATAFLKMLFYTMFFKAAEDEKCLPVVKLLDIIILAAHKVRLEYTSDDEDYCTFIEVPTDEGEYAPTEQPKAEKPQDYPRRPTEQPKAEKPQDYPRRTTKPVSTSTEYVTESSNSPCSEESQTTQDPSKIPCPRSSEKPEATTEAPKTITETSSIPCPDNETKTEKSYPKEPSGDNTVTEEEIIAEDDDYQSPLFTGSVRGIPGEHYPNYRDIPITSFSCSDKKYMPGFYADLETGCQVFHVCYEHRRESFLCPIGTIFNQPILACDYWYSSNCSLAPVYYDVNAQTEEISKEEIDSAVVELISTIAENQQQVSATSKPKDQKYVEEALDGIVKFLPVKVQVVMPDVPTEMEQPVVSKEPEGKGKAPKKPEGQDIQDIASKIFDQILTSATHAVSKTRDAIDKIPEPSTSDIESGKIPVQPMKISLSKTKASTTFKVKAKAVAKAKLVVPLAAKLAAVPVVKAAAAAPFVAKAKLAVPVVTKTKLAAAVPIKVLASKAAIPIAAKGKVVAAAPVAKAAAVKASIPLSVKKLATVPKVALKASVPVIKGKAISSIPLAKSAVFKSAISVSKAKVAPALKAKFIKTASAPIAKGKFLTLPLAKSMLAGSVPLMKAKIVKSAAISPLTKKALAVGYMKLLKAKKLAMMG